MVVCFNPMTQQGCGARHRSETRFCPQCGQNLVRALQVQDIGMQIGAYRVIDLIGHGGFGVVYLAEDTQHQPSRRVALKETFDAQSIQGLRDEFAVLRQLRHMHLPAYYEVFEHQGYGYLAMEYVPGQSLADVLRQQAGPLPEGQVLGYTIQICDALLYLHGQQPPIIHRDIKPANIRLTPAGLIKLVDFGLLKQGGGVTRDSRRAGTPGYAPLEQYGGRGGTDARSDIYSLGATLYHLLTGVEPEDALDRVSSTADPLLAPQARNGLISVHVSAAVVAALAPMAKDRPREVSHFKQALLEMSSIPAVGGSARTTLLHPTSVQPAPPKAPVTVQPVSVKPQVSKQELDHAMEIALREAEELVQDSRPSDRAVAARRLDVSNRLRDLSGLSSNWRTLAHPDPVLRNRAAMMLDRLNSDVDRPGLHLVKADYWAARIEPGTFSMGEEKDKFDYRIRQPYALGRFPVTNRQYLLFLEALAGHGTPEAIAAARKLLSLIAQHKQTSEQFYPFYWPGARYRAGEGNHPVMGVIWYAATAFAWWVNETFLTPEQRINGESISLPTEAEWERAAAYPLVLPGGKPRAGRRDYPWGATLTEASSGSITSSIEANIDESKIGGTSVVGIFPHGAAACGVEEMGGNVWEWCSTPYQAYPFKDEVLAETIYTVNLSSRNTYVMRGGSWSSGRGVARCAYRVVRYPSYLYVGFGGLRLTRLFSSV